MSVSNSSQENKKVQEVENLDKDMVYIEYSRIPVLIGKEGATKLSIEEEFEVNLEINSSNGEVLISGVDASKRYVASLVIQAIHYGFSPQSALLLNDEHNVLDVIDVKLQVRQHSRLKIVMGRIIGNNGQTRKLIEEITNCKISILESRVGIIGSFENVQLVHEALEMLINGASHKSFYSYLERNKTSQFEF